MKNSQPANQPAPLSNGAILLVVALMFSWGLNQVAIKVGNQGVNPMVMASARAIVGGALVFLWCFWRKIPIFSKDGTLLAGAFAGLLFGAEFVLIFIAMEFTTVARTTLLMNMMPFWVAIGSHFILGEQITLRALIGMIVAFAGVTIVFSDDITRISDNAYWGDLLAIVAGFLWGMTSIVIKASRLAHTSPEKTLLYQLAMGAIIPLPFIPLMGEVIRQPDIWTLVAFVYQAALVVAATYPLWFWMIRRYPVSKLSNFAFITPVVGVLMSGLILKEPLGLKIVLAMVFIALGLFIINKQPTKKRVPSTN